MALHELHCLSWAELPLFTTVLTQGWLRASSVLCVVPVLPEGGKRDQQELGWPSAIGCVFLPPHTASRAVFSPCGPVHLLSEWEKQNQKGRGVLILETLLTGSGARKWPIQIFPCAHSAIPPCLFLERNKEVLKGWSLPAPCGDC